MVIQDLFLLGHGWRSWVNTFCSYFACTDEKGFMASQQHSKNFAGCLRVPAACKALLSFGTTVGDDKISFLVYMVYTWAPVQTLGSHLPGTHQYINDFIVVWAREQLWSVWKMTGKISRYGFPVIEGDEYCLKVVLIKMSKLRISKFMRTWLREGASLPFSCISHEIALFQGKNHITGMSVSAVHP